MDWYEKIYQSLQICEKDRILDLGCGYAKLWRNNWDKIPPNVTIDGYDLHGSWADDFANYLAENKSTLKEGTDIIIHWEDIESSSAWEKLQKEPLYSKVVAHYLTAEILDMEALVKRASNVLQTGGMLSVNYYGLTTEYDYWEEVFAEIGLDLSFALERRDEKMKQHKQAEALLQKYFDRLEYIRVPGPLVYKDAEELFKRIVRYYANAVKYLESQKHKIIIYFNQKISENDAVVVQADTGFWHCFK